ncbi:WD-40 repeat-containing protein [Rippkaea orientalis PCC 8801]|uniref:WD-40 repeat-containing protein n=1 Tax=Rippkaea orientalis (strain PCC 8801 / RF-1) TaxID=41431 RepID=B7K1A3_RIPO1|nr:serine protease [Rippkaea orientalis]ACK66298.1 WD-40 repeat-containing protein [Rippkaea orientalis PCC 8801]
MQWTLNYQKFWLIFLGIVISSEVAIAVPKPLEKIAKEITVRVVGKSGGTGILIDRRKNSYTVLTNAHVFKQPGERAIITNDGKCYPIIPKTIQTLPQLDLAVLVFSSPVNYSLAKMGKSEQLTPNQTVYVSGWAASGGTLHSRVFLITEGELTKTNSSLPLGYRLTYTNLVRVGMSGGSVLDEQGNVVGINGIVHFANNTSDQIVASAIPINSFIPWYNQHKNKLPLPPVTTTKCQNNWQ